MNSPYDDGTWNSQGTSWLALISRILPFVIFIIIAAGGMVAAYVFFSPAGSDADMVAAVRTSSLSAPFFKAAPAKPVSQRLAQSPQPIRIGIISGHHNFDPGAVCEDGLTEESVNFDIANRVVGSLRLQGIRTELLDEFDDRLSGYSGTALISIHADSCEYYHEGATGFKIAGSAYTDSTRLSTCLEESYRTTTQLPYHADTITIHMTDYHAFREIGLGTPAVIIETGFMNLDRELLTANSHIPAEAITNGILCFMNAN